MCASVRVTEDVDLSLTDIGAVAQHSEWPSINISIKGWKESDSCSRSRLALGTLLISRRRFPHHQNAGDKPLADQVQTKTQRNNPGKGSGAGTPQMLPAALPACSATPRPPAHLPVGKRKQEGGSRGSGVSRPDSGP